MLPVNPKAASIVDDYDEECDPESDDYPEENAEIDTGLEEGYFSLVSNSFNINF